MEIRVGMVGYDEIGRARARAWRALGECDDGTRVRMVAVAAPENRATTARRDAGFELITRDAEEVIAHPDVDVVDVCAPPGERAPILRSALAAGKHILCSHPLTLDLRDAEEISALGNRVPGQKRMASDYVLLPAVQRAGTLVRGERLGEIHVLRCTCQRPLPDERPPEMAGSALYGLLPHALDMARFLNGEIAELCATLEAMLDPDEIERSATTESIACLLRFANGSVGTLDVVCSSAVHEEGMRVEAFGSDGGLLFDLDMPHMLMLTDRVGRPFQSTDENMLAQTAASATVRAFADRREPREAGDPDFRDGLMVVRVIAAIRNSAETGTWRKVDLGR